MMYMKKEAVIDYTIYLYMCVVIKIDWFSQNIHMVNYLCVFYQRPDEKPPGGTRTRPWGSAAGAGAGAAGFATGAAATSALGAGAAAAGAGAAAAGAETGLEATSAFGGGTDATGAAAGAAAGADFEPFGTERICSTFTFGSVVFMQKFIFDEFCWSYLGRAWIAGAGASPKSTFDCPPPGGFNTRLELLPPPRPMLNSVEVIFLILFRPKIKEEKKTRSLKITIKFVDFSFISLYSIFYSIFFTVRFTKKALLFLFNYEFDVSYNGFSNAAIHIYMY